jgi:GxxExxY protein
MNADRTPMIHEDLSGKIIGSAMAVLNELGPGLDEKIYERALVTSYGSAVIPWISKKHIRFFILGSWSGILFPT